MCVIWEGEWERTTEPLLAYKVVTEERFSPIDPRARLPQDQSSNFGSVVEYEEGKLLSADHPGFYLYPDRAQTSVVRGWLWGLIAIEVTIPAGAYIRRARDHSQPELKVLNAQQVIPGAKID